jgi:hypothetical protein
VLPTKHDSEKTPKKPTVPNIATAPPEAAELLRNVHAVNKVPVGPTTRG